MIIGATAITHSFPVLTMNVKDFKRIDGLEVLEASGKCCIILGASDDGTNIEGVKFG